MCTLLWFIAWYDFLKVLQIICVDGIVIWRGVRVTILKICPLRMDKAFLCSEDPGWQVIEVIFCFFVLRIRNGEGRHGAVPHAQDDTPPVCRGLHRLQLCLFKDNDNGRNTDWL